MPRFGGWNGREPQIVAPGALGLAGAARAGRRRSVNHHREPPTASNNCGDTSRGLPVGLRSAGRRSDDLRVLQMSRAWERMRPAQGDWPFAQDLTGARAHTCRLRQLARATHETQYERAADQSTQQGGVNVDRRSFLGLFGGLAAAVALLKSSPGEAMPVAKPADVAPAGAEPAVATDADMESVKTENVQWRRRRWRRRRYRVYRRYYRRRWRRRYWRPRYYRRRYYWRPRYYYRWW